MKTLFFLSAIFIYSSSLGQTKKTIYCFPGQGSDRRIFDSLVINSNYKLKFVEYETPEKGMTMENFARFLSNKIDTTEAFILLGVSLGGMICTEIAEQLKPEKTIIISIAKNKNELPLKYSFQKGLPLYKLLPKGLLLLGAKILQPIVEPDRNRNKNVFKQMLSRKNSRYMKRTIGLIVNWEKQTNQAKIIHIHGTKDNTIPIKRLKNIDFVIENGSHMITLTEGKKISEVLNIILKD